VVRRGFLAGMVGFAALVLFAPAAPGATVTLGQVAPPGAFFDCTECSDLQGSTDPASPGYAVPPLPASGAPWTMVSWSARGSSGPGSARALVWRPTGTIGEYRLVANTADGQFAAGAIGTFTTSIPVQPGDVLGVRSSTSFAPLYDSVHSADVEIGAVGDPVIGDTTGGPGSTLPFQSGSNLLLNVSATLSAPDPAVKRKCKKKKHKRSAESAKKKKCKKHKKKAARP
jgi:hypothetical protein